MKQQAHSGRHEVTSAANGGEEPKRGWWQRARSCGRLAAPAAVALLALILYTWALSRNGMANSYYAAAVKSATISWKAFFFGSLDPGSFITVDKPPLSIWVMALFGRAFGFSSWSMLVPQALAGVASVLVLHRLVKRWRGETAAFLAALALALTPVAVLIFRYNNPDAVLVLLILLSTWAFWSALERGATWRLVLAGGLLGLAFLTKMLMGLMVLPAFVLVYLLCGPYRLRRRMLQGLAGVGALAIGGGWWLAVAELWPDGARPHVGGTTGDSWMELIFSRSAGLLDDSTLGANLSGSPGWLRIFNDQLGGQVAWLLPLALVGLVAGLVVGLAVVLRPGGVGSPRRAGSLRVVREDKRLAGYLLWGLWTLVMLGVFNTASGTLHSYYTVVLAPGVAALAGAGAVELWQLGRRRKNLAWLLAAAVAGNAAWSAVLLARVPGYAPGLVPAVVAMGLVGAVGLLLVLVLGPETAYASRRGWQVLVGVAVVVSVAALLAGPLAYSVSTIGRPVTGNTPAAGPVRGGARPAERLGGGAPTPERLEGGADWDGSSRADLRVDQGLLAFLQQNRGEAKYLVAVQATAESIPIILATGEPVVTLGGYKSRDPFPTVTELEEMVAKGELRYVWLTAGSGGAGYGSSASRKVLQEVVKWVKANGSVVEPDAYGATAKGTLYFFGE